MPNTKLLTAALATLVTATGGPGCSDDSPAIDDPTPDAGIEEPDAPLPPPPQPSVLALPGNAFYPENVHADDDGTLYVGSLATGEVVAFVDGDATPHTLIAAGQHGITGVTGVHVRGSDLWLCAVDTTFQRPTELRKFTLAGTTATPAGTHELLASQFCNDMDIGSDGTVYIADSFAGSIQQFVPGVGFSELVQDARFVPDSQGAFGLDGIVRIGNRLIVNKLDTGELFSVSITTGSVEPITLAQPLSGPDGMRALDDDTLVVVEGNANRLSRIDLAGSTATVTTIVDTLDMPTGVTLARGHAWVTEGQLGRLFTGMTPNLPFSVRRVDI